MQIDSRNDIVDQSQARRDWVAPHYTKMSAGDAEQGPNPDALDNGVAKS